MEKFKETLKKTMPDELSAFIILGVVTVAIVTTIGIYALSKYNKSLAVSGTNLESVEEVNEEDVQSIENLTSVENVNSIEELQKINEKEIEEAKKKEEEKDKDTDKSKSSTSTSLPYYIKVNYKAQVVTVYGKDSKGKYTKPVRAMVCSTGIQTPTGGVYKIPAKIRWCHMVGDVWGQYSSQIVGDILFHSVPYLRKGDHSSLEYWAYDKLGTKASLGCVRLTCKDAKLIFDNCKVGTQVEFYASSNPGPLGKPSARKISNAPSYIRGWDPTDPVSNNPWKEYLKKQETDKNTNKNQNNTNKNQVTNKNETDKKEPVVNKPTVNETINETANEIEHNEVSKPTVNEVVVNEVVNAVI